MNFFGFFLRLNWVSEFLINCWIIYLICYLRVNRCLFWIWKRKLLNFDLTGFLLWWSIGWKFVFLIILWISFWRKIWLGFTRVFCPKWISGTPIKSLKIWEIFKEFWGGLQIWFFSPELFHELLYLSHQKQPRISTFNQK
jgi:hypothetical protein